jgi:hypothetical protein
LETPTSDPLIQCVRHFLVENSNPDRVMDTLLLLE